MDVFSTSPLTIPQVHFSLTWQRMAAIIHPSKHDAGRGIMGHLRDSLLVNTLARTTHAHVAGGAGAKAGLEFEQALYSDLLNVADWKLSAGPDELDMSGLVRSQTGVRYEFDCALLAADALYIIEAKRHARITRQQLGEFITKLLDIALGSADEIASLSIKPVFVSGLPNIDTAAWSYAVSWGVLLIAPSRPTPWELIASIESAQLSDEGKRRVVDDCNAVGDQLWRPFNAIVSLADARDQRFNLSARAIYDARRAAEVLDYWTECQRAVEILTNVRHAL